MATEFLHSLDTYRDERSAPLCSDSEANTRDRWTGLPPGHGVTPSGPEAGAVTWVDLIRHQSHLVMAVVEIKTSLEGEPQVYQTLFAND